MSRRRFGRIRAIAGLAFALCWVPVWLLIEPDNTLARQLGRSFFRRITVTFGLDVYVTGEPALSALIVTNHISWTDIAALASLVDADFVAKSEVGKWPVIGALARRFGIIFVARDKRISSNRQADAIRARLASGRSVILFPEGTTSNGSAILPFHTSLFAAANAVQSVQPAIIRYSNVDGSALSTQRQREVAWVDDDELLDGAMRVARERTRMDIVFLEPIDPRNFVNRKLLAEATRTAIVKAYAAAPNRPR